MAVEKKEIFIASRFEEFKDLREILRIRINQFKFLEAIDLNDNKASHRSPLDESLFKVKKSDVMILLVGETYGTIPDGEQYSYTHLEYKEAVSDSSNTRVLVFCIGDSYSDKYINYSSDINMKSWQLELEKNHRLSKFSNIKDANKIAENILTTTLTSIYELNPMNELALSNDTELFIESDEKNDDILNNDEIFFLDKQNAELEGYQLINENIKNLTHVELLKMPGLLESIEQKKEAELAIELGEYNTAIMHLKKSLEIKPLDFESNYWLAKIYIKSAKKSLFNDIETSLIRASKIALKEKNIYKASNCYLLIVQAAIFSERKNEGIKYLKFAEELTPNFARLYFEKTKFLLSFNEQKEAKKSLKEAINIRMYILKDIAKDPFFIQYKEFINDIKKETRIILLNNLKILDEQTVSIKNKLNITNTQINYNELTLYELWKFTRDNFLEQYQLLIRYIADINDYNSMDYLYLHDISKNKNIFMNILNIFEQNTLTKINSNIVPFKSLANGKENDIIRVTQKSYTKYLESGGEIVIQNDFPEFLNIGDHLPKNYAFLAKVKYRNGEKIILSRYEAFCTYKVNKSSFAISNNKEIFDEYKYNVKLISDLILNNILKIELCAFDDLLKALRNNTGILDKKYVNELSLWSKEYQENEVFNKISKITNHIINAIRNDYIQLNTMNKIILINILLKYKRKSNKLKDKENVNYLKNKLSKLKDSYKDNENSIKFVVDSDFIYIIFNNKINQIIQEYKLGNILLSKNEEIQLINRLLNDLGSNKSKKITSKKQYLENQLDLLNGTKSEQEIIIDNIYKKYNNSFRLICNEYKNGKFKSLSKNNEIELINKLLNDFNDSKHKRDVRSKRYLYSQLDILNNKDSKILNSKIQMNIEKESEIEIIYSKYKNSYRLITNEYKNGNIKNLSKSDEIKLIHKLLQDMKNKTNAKDKKYKVYLQDKLNQLNGIVIKVENIKTSTINKKKILNKNQHLEKNEDKQGNLISKIFNIFGK